MDDDCIQASLRLKTAVKTGILWAIVRQGNEKARPAL